MKTQKKYLLFPSLSILNVFEVFVEAAARDKEEAHKKMTAYNESHTHPTTDDLIEAPSEGAAVPAPAVAEEDNRPKEEHKKKKKKDKKRKSDAGDDHSSHHHHKR